jgi:maltokinase
MVTGTGARFAALEARALAAVAAIQPRALAEARWSGLGGQSIRSIGLVDVFGFEDGGVLAVIEAIPAAHAGPMGPAGRPTAADPAAVRMTLPLDDADPWLGLHALASQGGVVAGARGGRLVARPGPAGGAPGSSVAPRSAPDAVRASAGDQSHTSVIVDERSILKLYRRLTPGPNPEAEVLGALAGVADAPVPAWVGEVHLALATGETTALAIEQAYVAGAVDAFELHAEGLAAWLAGEGEAVPTTLAAATGVALGQLHAALAAVPGTAFTPRPALPEDRAAWLAAAEARLPAAVAAVGPVDPELADRIAAAGNAVRRALRPLGDPAIPVRLQRIHGDLHLGQVLPTPDGVLLVDFEGDPMLPAAARRGLGAPLADLAGFLRSLDHVARSGFRRAGIRLGGSPGPAAAAALDGWIDSARAACLAGYADGPGSPDWPLNRALLRAFEVDKELREFAYAATFLPDWLYAPAGGLPALLGGIGEPVAGGTPG